MFTQAWSKWCSSVLGQYIVIHPSCLPGSVLFKKCVLCTSLCISYRVKISSLLDRPIAATPSIGRPVCLSVLHSEKRSDMALELRDIQMNSDVRWWAQSQWKRLWLAVGKASCDWLSAKLPTRQKCPFLFSYLSQLCLEPNWTRPLVA